MRRRRRDNLDSLELLLDTVCNMFGGVIFIAILLALLAGRSGDTDPSASMPGQEHSDLRAEVERIEASLAMVMGIVMSGDTLDAEIAALISEIAQAEERIQRARAQMSRLADAGQSVTDRLNEAANRQSELKGAIAELDSRLKEEQQRRVSAARLPVAKATAKVPIHVVVRKTHAFEIYRNDGHGGYLEQPLDVDVHRDGLGGAVHRVRLKENGGFVVDERLRTSGRWRSILGRISPDKHFLYMMVYPSGYSAFRELRDAALREGFDYDLILLSEDEQIILSPGSDFRTQ
jgi:hypothetical protein